MHWNTNKTILLVKQCLKAPYYSLLTYGEKNYKWVVRGGELLFSTPHTMSEIILKFCFIKDRRSLQFLLFEHFLVFVKFQVTILSELIQSGKASDKLLFMYIPFLGLGVLAILRGMLPPTRTTSSMIGKRPMLGRKKKA